MTTWTTAPTGESPRVKLSDEDIEQIRSNLQQRGFDRAAKQVRDHYSPRQFQPDTFVAYRGDNPVYLALELLAILAANDLIECNPDRTPAYHEGTFLEHLDMLRAAVGQLGELQRDQLLEDQIWFWTNVACEAPPSREQLIEDIRQQTEAEIERRAREWMRKGYQMRLDEERRNATTNV